MNSDATQLQQKYQNFVNSYAASWLDFDIEGSALDNVGANDRRNQAIAGLQKVNPNLRVSFTLPVESYGLLANSLALIRSAIARGVRVDCTSLHIKAPKYA